MFQWFLVLDHHQKLGVILGITHHHPAQDFLAIAREKVLLVHGREGVVVRERADADRLCSSLGASTTIGIVHVLRTTIGEVIPKACNVHAHEFKLRRHINAILPERPHTVHGSLSQVESQNICHLDARCDESIGPPAPVSTLPDSIDVWSRSRKMLVNNDPAMRVDVYTGRSSKFVAGCDANGEYDQLTR